MPENNQTQLLDTSKTIIKTAAPIETLSQKQGLAAKLSKISARVLEGFKNTGSIAAALASIPAAGAAVLGVANASKSSSDVNAKPSLNPTDCSNLITDDMSLEEAHKKVYDLVQIVAGLCSTESHIYQLLQMQLIA